MTFSDMGGGGGVNGRVTEWHFTQGGGGVVALQNGEFVLIYLMKMMDHS